MGRCYMNLQDRPGVSLVDVVEPDPIKEIKEVGELQSVTVGDQDTDGAEAPLTPTCVAEGR